MDDAAVPVRTPSIETERLRLRGHRAEDLDAAAAMWADPAVVRYISGVPSTQQQTWARILGYVGHWRLLGFGYWALEERATNRFIGELGFADFKRSMEPSIRGMPELGWALASAVHGRGYGTEAVAAAAAWGDAHLDAEQTVSLIKPDNRASIRIAEKCGFRETYRTEYNGAATIVFTRTRGAGCLPAAPE